VLEVELEVVDLSAVASVDVHQLVVEHAEPEVELAHPCPMFDKTSTGIAATEMIAITIR
jgi:hypothetical protein